MIAILQRTVYNGRTLQSAYWRLLLSDNNLYLELELFLDPPTIDFDKLKEELSGKISEWNKLTNSGPKYKYMVQIAAAFCKRTEPPGERHGTSLTNQAAEARQKREAEGKKAAAVYEEDGILEQKEYDALFNEYKGQFAPATIDAWFKLPPFVPPDEPDYPDGVKEKIVAKSEMDKIAADMKIALGDVEASLYDILGVPPTATLDTLQQHQKAAYDKAHKKPKSGPESAKVDAELRLLGYANVFFKDKTARQGYDIAMKRRPFDALAGSVFRRRAMKGSVTRDEYMLSIKDTREKTGFSQAEAEWLVYGFYCSTNKFKPLRMRVDRIQGQQCPKCYALNDEDTKVCRCGLPLKIECPRCKRIGSFGDKACTQCGFELGDMPIALERRDQAKKALVAGNFEEAEEHIRYVNLYWENVPGAETVRKQLKEQKDKIKALRQQIKKFELDINDAVGKRLFFEARRLFQELRQMPESATSLLQEEQLVNQTIAEVQRELTALASVNVLSEKIELCEKILTLAADCAEARSILAQIPPPPPEHLVATVIPLGIELKWTAPAVKSSYTFVIVRKVGSTPASIHDGIQLHGGITYCPYVDSTVDIGIIYGYALFTQRDKTIETTGCRSCLVQTIEDVRDVSILPGDGSLTVSWQEQTGCREMIVTRFTGNTLNGEGIRIPLQGAASFVDTGLDNETTYSYRIQSVFRGIDGADILSPGKIISARPQAPPQAVVDLKASESNDGTTLLQWSLPPNGDVLLFELGTAPEIPVGTVEWTTLVELKKRFGDPIPVLGKGQTLWRNTSTGVRYVLPVTFHAGLAVFGKSDSVIQIADVSDLTLDYIGDTYRLTWSWPKGLQSVLIAYCNDEHPAGPNDPRCAKVELSRQEYDLEKSWLLPIRKSQEYYFCVYACVEQSFQKIFSRGCRVQTAKTIIRYAVSLCRKFVCWGKIDAKIILTIDSSRGQFPDLMVKKDFGKPPLNREHGSLLIDIPARSGRELVVPLDIHALEEDTYIKIFVKNSSEAELYIIDSPPRETLRLSVPQPTLGQFWRLVRGWICSVISRQAK